MSRKLQVFWMVTLVTLVVVSVAHAQQGRRGRFGGGTDLFRVAANEAVQKDVGIATDQADKIREIAGAFRTEQRQQREDLGVSRQERQDLSPEERREVFAEIQKAGEKLLAEYEPKLAEVVSKEQMARLKEIRVQAAGLTDRAVRKELGVTEQQQEELAAIQQEFRGKQRELRQGGGGGGNREARAKLSQEQQDASVKILTDDQQAKYVAMKGKPFDVSQLRRGRGRGQRRRQ